MRFRFWNLMRLSADLLWVENDIPLPPSVNLVSVASPLLEHVVRILGSFVFEVSA